MALRATPAAWVRAVECSSKSYLQAILNAKIIYLDLGQAYKNNLPQANFAKSKREKMAFFITEETEKNRQVWQRPLNFIVSGSGQRRRGWTDPNGPDSNQPASFEINRKECIAWKMFLSLPI